MPCRDDETLEEENGRSTVQNDHPDQIDDSYIYNNLRLVVNRRSLWNSVPALVDDENPYAFARIQEASTLSKSASENLDNSDTCTCSWSRSTYFRSYSFDFWLFFGHLCLFFIIWPLEICTV